MLYLYSGTPGSGKSYHAVKDALDKLRRKERNRVIANFPLSVPAALADRFEYWDNPDVTIERLISYARARHAFGVEGQTLVILDEAQCLFNSRDWNSGSNKRMEWIKFFSQHRKLGFNFILVAQFDRMLDRQIRCLIEYDVKHLKVNNGFFAFLPFTCFLAVEKWYGQNMKLGSQVLVYRPKIAKLYDSYALFATEDAQVAGEGPAQREGTRMPERLSGAS